MDFGYYNMDCMDGMKEFPDGYFDLAIVDPPYGLHEHGGKNRNTFVKQKNGTKTYVKDGQYENRGWDNEPPSSEYFEELFRVSKNQIIWGCNYFDFTLAGGLIVWDKCNDGSDQSDAEVAFCSLTKRIDIFRYMWRGMFQGKSITEGTIQQGNKALNEKRIHPTQKPVVLYEWLLNRYANPGDIILDTHVGSASSLIACYRTNHPYVGFELDKHYYDLSKKRLDKITVIRDGSTIETLVKGKDDITESRIIKGMVGREISDRFPKREPHIGEIRMEVKDWTVHHPLYSDRKVVDNVNLNVRKGEVVGISGLMGAGRTELAMSLFGKSYGSNISGELYINGQIVNLNSVQEAIKNRLAYVTEDRKGNGLILSNPIKINTTLANLDAVSSHTVIDKDKEYNVAVDYKKKLNTKCPTVEQNVGNLSGGNQQKVLLAKWMFADPDILILDEPTRGIDVGAKYEIYCIINQLVAEGKSVIMISSELPEILGMCDRIYVMNEGKIVGELAGSEATQELIMSKILSAGKKGALA